MTTRGDLVRAIIEGLDYQFLDMLVSFEKGLAVISLANDSQIEMDQQSLLSIDQMDRLSLLQGRIDFRISPAADTSLKVGNLSMIKSRLFRHRTTLCGSCQK
jgi:uncharacterized protein YhdP